MEEKESMFEEALRKAGVEGAEYKTMKVVEYVEMLRTRRRWAGLTSRKVAEDPWRAVAESISVLDVLECKESMRLAEVGSGGGILGIVLSIACPCWKVELIESSARKSAFLAEVVGSVGVSNCYVRMARAEKGNVGQMYDAVLTRAAGTLEKVVPLALRLLKSGGLYVAVKGVEPTDEVEEAAAVIAREGGRLVGVEYTGNGPKGEQAGVSLVVVQKV